MEQLLIIRNGEISIKGDNRILFEKRLIQEIKFKLREFKNIKIIRETGRIHIYLNGENSNEVTQQVKDVFGVVSISPAYKFLGGYETIKDEINSLLQEKLDLDREYTFKVNVKRQDKSFPMKSPEMTKDIGGNILKNFPNLKVDVISPEIYLTVEHKLESSLVFFEKIQGVAGLPVGINGKGCVLLSGGIDSPVAAYLMAKRGLKIEAVHFHSYPFTNEQSMEKVVDLAKKISFYTGKIRIHMVNLLEIQKEISQKCPEELMTILSRRFMMAIAEKIALGYDCNSLITGESLGQVASQTAEGLKATTDSVKELPIFRPLIGFDKEDIITLAKKIDTFETSIIPEEDCCTVFLPKKPATKPSLQKIHFAEQNLDKELLIEAAINNSKIREVY